MRNSGFPALRIAFVALGRPAEVFAIPTLRLSSAESPNPSKLGQEAKGNQCLKAMDMQSAAKKDC